MNNKQEVNIKEKYKIKFHPQAYHFMIGYMA